MEDLHKIIASQRDIMDTTKELYARFEARNSTDRTAGYMNILGQELDDLHQQFKYQHDEITRLIREMDILVEHVSYMTEKCYFEFSELYFCFKGSLMDTLPQRTIFNSPLSSTFAVPHCNADTTATMEAKLPKIALPTFSGDYMEWVPFRDIYVSLVHGNAALTKVQKFYYLKGTLSGEAAGLIRTFSATEANYDSAWAILESRYHNKRMIVGTLTTRLFNIPKADGTFQSIKMLLDTTQECLSSLANLGIDTDTWDPLLIHLMCQKLDLQTRKDWEHSLKSSTDIPSRHEMFNFLERTFRTLESLHDEFPTSSRQAQPKMSNKNRRISFNATNFSRKANPCEFCGRNHFLSKCYQFLALPLRSKNSFLSNRNVCLNCLVPGHDRDNCPSSFRCGICKNPHHTVLHDESYDQLLPTNSTTDPSDISENRVVSHNAHVYQDVFLYTIRLLVEGKDGKIPLRALLDPGSQGSLISESAVQLLGIRKNRSFCKVVGVGIGTESISRSTVELSLWSRKSVPVLSCTALVLGNISSYKPNSYRRIPLPDVQFESLADPFYYDTDPIDIILGSDVGSRIKIPKESFVSNGLFFQNTYFGWVFSGSINRVSNNILCLHNVGLESIVKSFWEQEEIILQRDLSEEEIKCEKFFERTTSVSSSGRYVVHLPFRSLVFDEILPLIHNNALGALKRFTQLENSFSRRQLFAFEYKRFMYEYESLGHMTKVGTYPKDVNRDSYFLPHHGVLKEGSTTTKLRVVFDGSSHLHGHSSLNEELLVGPALQNDLPQIITRWRRHKFAFSADIEKMFRQIEVCRQHRSYQQILWRFKPSDDISIYQLNTVTYGTTSAPYLSIRVLRQLANDFRGKYPQESEILLSDSYVDDIISGADTLEDAISLYRGLSALLKLGGFNLRKWTTNCAELLDIIPEEFRETSATLQFDRDNVVKTLGVQWGTADDSFSFRVNLIDDPKISKRTILSESARLYDPLGWLTPSTLIAKCLFKELWEHKVDWDSEIPQSIRKKWLEYRSSLLAIANLRIPRWLNTLTTSDIELHCFCDASPSAYAAVVYARVHVTSGISVNIIQAKSKVSPMKTVTIPRLELCAASLVVKLSSKILTAFPNVKAPNIFFWSDSFTVLSWIRKPPSYWNIYVANRVGEIQRFSDPTQWRYVPTKLNPADCASRGVLPHELLSCESWWHGPQFLCGPPNTWPQNLTNLATTEEERKVLSHSVINRTYPDFLLRFSKLTTLLRVISLCFVFANKCRYPQERNNFSLSGSNLSHAMLTITKLTQGIDFSDDIKNIIAKGEVRHKPLLKLRPFIDDCGLIRVGGRLHQGSFPYDFKHPYLLSKTNPLSKLIIADAHEKTLHGGLSLTMSYVNRKFWILSGNQLAKSIIHNCIRCFKYSAKTSSQVMGNLPAVRLNATRPFKHSGVDYAGPISIRNSNLRSSIISKGYICLFICMVTKAIHLELVSDLTTNSFLAAFKRFVARRGSCTDIYSDCGTNFVGASKELRVLYNKSVASLPEEIRQSLISSGTNWHFIPPASPNFGGLWEAGVKSVKFHLKRVIHDRILSYEELSTVLSQIEGCLNSRPLCPMSSDPTDMEALTPAHFLIGEPTTCIAEPSLIDTNINHLTRWKVVEKIKQHFWKRWYSEYLNRLQSRPKWLKDKPTGKIGDLVLIADERCGPAQWIIGRIQDVHPGPDNRVRVVTVLTKDSNTAASDENGGEITLQNKIGVEAYDSSVVSRSTA